MVEPEVLLMGATAVGSLGAAWGGAKVALNGTRSRVQRIESVLDEHIDEDEQLNRDSIDRLARLETKIDILLQK